MTTATKPVPKERGKKFFNSINYFRGIAIILIVLGHSFDLAHWQISSGLEQFVYSLSLNGTVYFIFISGFLYYQVFYHRFNYKKFLTKKIQYVLAPYVLSSLIPILYAIFFNDGGPTLPDALKDQPLMAIAWYLLTGNVILAYWYIPMAMLLFAISPLVNVVIQSGQLMPCIVGLMPISLIVHRPIENLNAVHSLIYFLPVYLIGIWSSIHYKRVYGYLKDNKKRAFLAVLAIGLGLIQVYVLKHPGNFHKEFFALTVIDVNLLQKIALCFLFLSILEMYEDEEIPSVAKVAETSFAIYFIHPMVLNGAFTLVSKWNWQYEGNFLVWLMVGWATVLVSMAIAYGFKALLRKKSRYLIGW
ncbi:acyltransferase family protein [Leptothoe kymatousa]|uniref:Acyltransferase n=1 Tax=Leptothoe kymatousa TAU-MAC 1615 TaxID=2364775 RepID=A0ABS5Y7J2_9CYAN|nr:acyltransferase [Leptothoe kymatousa]MBT9313468.1 acyltransferase [Leptothoe kymatousa TAU-MAC 1615]